MDADVECTDIALPPRGGRRLTGVASRLAAHAASISLVVVFYLAVTPIGVVRSWLGRSPIERRRRADIPSYRMKRQARGVSHLTKQY